MLIKLDSSTANNEWCLLEFQGEIVGDLTGSELGRIVVKDDGRAEMEIGQHFLEGSVVSLKLPYLIIQKNSSHSDEAKSDVPSIPIEGYVRKKIIFKTRPKPIGLKRVLP